MVGDILYGFPLAMSDKDFLAIFPDRVFGSPGTPTAASPVDATGPIFSLTILISSVVISTSDKEPENIQTE